jgi:hypothetical protein
MAHKLTQTRTPQYRPTHRSKAQAQTHQGGVQPLVLAVAPPPHEALREVHVDEPTICLNHAILQPGGDTEFVSLDAQRNVGLTSA